MACGGAGSQSGDHLIPKAVALAVTSSFKKALLAVIALALTLSFAGRAAAHPLDEVVICDGVSDIYQSPDPMAGGMGSGLGGDGVPMPRGCRVVDGAQANLSAAPIEELPFTFDIALATLGKFIVLGFEHIVPGGIDHILFVVALFLSVTALRPLLVQITAFTVAHSLTLALAALGLIDLSPEIINPLILITIAFVGFENVVLKKPLRFRPAIIFGFGLLHGIGFASGLAGVGLSTGPFLTALVAFNVGVELGQLAILLASWAALSWFLPYPWYRERVVVPVSLLISMLTIYWLTEGIFAALT